MVEDGRTLPVSTVGTLLLLFFLTACEGWPWRNKPDTTSVFAAPVNVDTGRPLPTPDFPARITLQLRETLAEAGYAVASKPAADATTVTTYLVPPGPCVFEGRVTDGSTKTYGVRHRTGGLDAGGPFQYQDIEYCVEGYAQQVIKKIEAGPGYNCIDLANYICPGPAME